MRLRVNKNDYSKLADRLRSIEKYAPLVGREIVGKAPSRLNDAIRKHLSEQGRGGEPPPLSGATLRLYDNLGGPDGSGITNHITLEYRVRNGKTIAILGIPTGDPTMIAKVQDRGAIIPVTAKMRAFLAANGIPLKASTTHIVVPARRFWTKSLRRVRAEVLQDFSRFFARLRQL